MLTEKGNQMKVNAFEDITIAMRNLYEKKNMDYGDSFAKSFQEWGLPMACIRLDDKLNRLKSFAKKQDMQVTDESVIDTLIDLANYAIMTIMELKKGEEIMSKCCICGCPLSGFGNNPWPVSHNENDRCCDFCNAEVVVPKRIELSFKNKEEEKENV